MHPTYDEPKQSCLEKGESVAFCSSPRGSLDGVSCAGESLCVAVGYEGSVFVSTDPTGGASAWSVGEVNEAGGHGATHLTGVSCPSPSLCVAVSGGSNNSNGGKVLTSTNPASGHWQTTQLGSSLDLRGVSCGTPFALRRRRPRRPDLRLDRSDRRRLGLDGSRDSGRAR